MRIFNRARAGYLATLAAGIAIGFTAVGTAVALPHHAAAAKAVTKHLTLAASAFAPDSLHDLSHDYFNEWDPATLGNTDPGRCFNAGAVLPNGATIRSVTFFFTNGAVSPFYGELNRQNLATHQSRTLAFVSTKVSPAPTYMSRTKSITSHNIVDTSKYAYGLGVCPVGDSSFTGVMINYQS